MSDREARLRTDAQLKQQSTVLSAATEVGRVTRNRPKQQQAGLDGTRSGHQPAGLSGYKRGRRCHNRGFMGLRNSGGRPPVPQGVSSPAKAAGHRPIKRRKPASSASHKKGKTSRTAQPAYQLRPGVLVVVPETEYATYQPRFVGVAV